MIRIILMIFSLISFQSNEVDENNFKYIDTQIKVNINEFKEKKELYNCKENGKEVFDDYKEDGYFVYQTNKKYGTSNFYPEDVKDCNIVTKTFYRKIKEVK